MAATIFYLKINMLTFNQLPCPIDNSFDGLAENTLPDAQFPQDYPQACHA
jgi:hypothetical protein